VFSDAPLVYHGDDTDDGLRSGTLYTREMCGRRAIFRRTRHKMALGGAEEVMRGESTARRRLYELKATNGFEAFFRANFATTVRIANALLRDVHLAEDVAQEAFIATRRRFPLGDPAEGWLHAAAVHLALNAARSRRRYDARAHLDMGPATPDGPEQVVVANEEDERVRRALRRLPRHSATVLVLRYSGLAYVEIADAMGVKPNHIGTMLRRAERALRKEVERETPE
jgi:RNA polymerase sigma factor (sigma-70 family)